MVVRLHSTPRAARRYGIRMHSHAPSRPPRGSRPAAGPMLAFLAFGLFAGCWAALFPAFRANAGVDEATMGLAFLASGLGALPAMLFAGSALDRLGERFVAVSLVAMAVATLATSYADSAPLLLLTFAMVGLTGATTDIAMNGAVAHEEARTRPLMNLAHAIFSVGAVIGGALTGLAREAGWDEPSIAACLVVVLLAVSATNRRGPWPVDPAHAAAANTTKPLFTRFLVGIGALVALSFVVEATSFTWSASHVEDTFDGSPGLAGLAVALYNAGSVTGRIGAHLWGSRMQARSLVVGSGLLVAAMSACVAASPTVTLVVVALFGLGLGTASVAPTLYSNAGASAPGRRGAALATVAMLGYAGNLAGPAIAGVAASTWSLRASFGLMAAIGLVLALGSAIALRGVGRVEPEHEPGPVPDNLGLPHDTR